MPTTTTLADELREAAQQFWASGQGRLADTCERYADALDDDATRHLERAAAHLVAAVEALRGAADAADDPVASAYLLELVQATAEHCDRVAHLARITAPPV